jgi:hypothetical protein
MTTSEYTVPQRPDVPPQAPKKKVSGWGIAGLIIAGLLVFGWISNAVDGGTTTADPVEPVGTTYTITAEMVVDAMPPATVSGFCDAYYALGDYDAALAQFEGGYGTSQDPSAEEVFDELLGRC